MSRKKVSRNAPCPCGSGKKYKHCCYGKDFDFVESDDGTIGREVEMTEELRDVTNALMESFELRHGRKPEPTDKLFDGAPPLEHIEHFTVEAMKKTGIDPALIHAYEKTSLLLNEQNERLVSESDVAEWEAAIDEYESKTGNKATHRRLTDGDFQGILEHGPD
jgi:hypothetical protein